MHMYFFDFEQKSIIKPEQLSQAKTAVFKA